MALWLVRAGRHGEYKQKFLQDQRIYLTWNDFDTDLGLLQSRAELNELLHSCYDEGDKTLSNWESQIWSFMRGMQIGDWVLLPSQAEPAIHIGEIKSDYIFDAAGTDRYFHYREIDWFAIGVPRAHFGKDLLFSLGAAMTICRIQRNDAEARLQAMHRNDWRAENLLSTRDNPQSSGVNRTEGEVAVEDAEAPKDYEELARDDISRFVMARFKGHDLARLVEAVLQAQGFVTHCSPPGPDGGVDILASGGSFGFAEPRVCVQVKSQESPVESAVLAQLKGAMEDTRSTHGILVAWGGFKNSITKEIRSNFFRVQFWSQKELLDQIFANYDRLPAAMRAELPLKQMWALVQEN